MVVANRLGVTALARRDVDIDVALPTGSVRPCYGGRFISSDITTRLATLIVLNSTLSC